MPLEIYNSSECEVIVRSHILNKLGQKQDIIYADEVQKRDVYGVRNLHKQGFLPQTIVDIGGNIGTFSMMANKYWPNAQIYAFEPDKPCFQVFKRNCPDVEYRNEAVIGFYGCEIGNNVHKCIFHTMDPEEPYRTRKLNNVISPSYFFSGAWNNILEFGIDFLKIDCEECEINIFRELDIFNYIKNINYIAGEWHGRHSREELISILSKTHICDFEDRPKGGIFKCQRI